MPESGNLRFAVERQTGVTMLRFYSGEQKGATAFFRNRPLLELLGDLIAEDPSPSCSSLFHACSVGAEVYSFVSYCHLRRLHEAKALTFAATDINPEFLEYARAARYPSAAIAALSPAERSGFETAGDDLVRPTAEVRETVRFLAPQSFVDARFETPFDLVFILNALTYVSPELQSATVDAVARYNSRYLVITAFHPDTIQADLERNGYHPVLRNLETIHGAWGDRVTPDDPPLPGTDRYSWALPRFSRIPGFEYRFCAVFEKRT